MPAFKKSQSVLKISRWNSAGCFYITPAVVVSCGAKQMVLQNAETGECLGRNFKPSVEQYNDSEVRADLTIEQARERALEMSAEWLAKEIARYETQIERNASDTGYVRSMTRSLEALRTCEPAVL